MNTSDGAVLGATVRTCRIRLDCTSTTVTKRATPSPMAGEAVRAADPGPARFAKPIRAGPAAKRRKRPASAAAARPMAHNAPKLNATPATITTAVSRVGAVITVSATRARGRRQRADQLDAEGDAAAQLPPEQGGGRGGAGAGQGQE